MCAITLICRRTSGVTQKSLWESIGMETKESIGMEPNQSIDMKPSKSIRMKANNFHYVVKTLQSQGLIVGKQAIVKSNDVGGETEYDSRDSLVVSTNLLYLSRYAKELNMNSYQRIEIAKPKLGRDEEINIDALQEDENLSVDYKSYVSIHDYLPAMKAICDKLEEASGKVNSSLPFVCVLLPPFQIIRRFDFFGTSILLCI
jgi:general transcription factor 3C polypeptide 1